MRSVIDLRKLGSFVTVAETRSFTRAAATLGIAQSALSKQIRDLEGEVGGELLHRTGRGVLPTDLADRILPEAKALLEQAAQLSESLRMEHVVTSGRVTIGTLAAIGPLFIVPLLLRMHECLPGIQVHVMEGLTDHVEEWLTSGRVDIGVHYRGRRTYQHETTLFGSELYLIGRSGAPMVSNGHVNLAQIEGIPLILPGMPNSLRASLERVFQQEGVELCVGYELDSVPTIKQIVSAGDEYTIVPLHAVVSELKAGTLAGARIINPSTERQVLISATTQHPSSRAGRAVIQLAHEVACEVRTILQNAQCQY